MDCKSFPGRCLIGVGLTLIGITLLAARAEVPTASTPESAADTPTKPLDADRAYAYLKQICEIGPRPSGSRGMQRQQKMLEEFFTKLGAKVTKQVFLAPNPLGGAKVRMTNLIVTWHPERTERVLLCAHYDTRPFPDQDPNPRLRRQGRFIGANDGASGVAVLMELAHLMPKLAGNLGVDFVLFDGEELVYVEGRDRYFWGSEWFAQQYVETPPEHTYRWGVLLDMVGDADLQIYHEQNSVTWPDTRPLVVDIWSTAQRLGVEEFVPRAKHLIRDDHLALRNIALIPTCNIIDFDYPYWHTEADAPGRCSGESLVKVGWVVYEWLRKEVNK
ncbi:MAG: M28 family peptidase [Pirellulales bacterium]